MSQHTWSYDPDEDPYFTRGEAAMPGSQSIGKLSKSDAINYLVRAAKIGLTVMARAGEIPTASAFTDGKIIEILIGSSGATFEVQEDHDKALFTEEDLADV